MNDNVAQSILNKQRLDKFRMVLTLPSMLRDLNTTNWTSAEAEMVNRDSLQFSIHSANIPDVSIGAKTLPTMGQTMKVTSQVRDSYGPISCKYVVDNRFKNYWVLWKWLEMINHPIDSGTDSILATDQKVIESVRREDLNDISNPLRQFDRAQVDDANLDTVRGITTQPIRKYDHYLDYQTTISIFPLDEYNNDVCEFKFYNAFLTKLAGFEFDYQNSGQVESSFTFEFGQMDLLLTPE